ncbi:hypothetical protein OG563_07230 [Nocardia vinacea]|uniref:DUF11 domain-containing protein n=1 Tax=Nocardia vinacea TaxID=96468 RepID=A0ABZ1Z0J5_9NOCA|nr:hypothetical protein [Nocardia vinacea]
MNTKFSGGLLAAAAAGLMVLSPIPAQAAGAPDMSVTTKPVSGAVGATVTLTLAFQNVGSGTAKSVRLEFAAPAGTTIETSFPDCTTSSDKSQMSCNSPDANLEPGYSQDQKVDLKIHSESAYVSAGSVTLSTKNDSNPANDTAAIQVTNPNGGGVPGLPSGSSSGSS